MITELFVENYPVDISKEIDALMTYCIDDIKDFSSRNTSFSKTIIIPGTAKNNKAFGNIFEMGAGTLTSDDSPNIGANYNIAKAAKCIMFQGNLQVFKGVIRILKIVIDRNHIEYECALFGELGGFISALGVKRLEDLDFSEYDHLLNMGNIEDSWNTFLQYHFDLQYTFPYPSNQLYYTRFDKDADKIYFLVVLDTTIFKPGTTIIVENTDTGLNDGTYTIESIETIQIPSTVPGVESPFFRSVITTVEDIAYNETTAFDLSVDTQRGSGYYYPLIDYGKASTDKHDYKYTTFRPALYVREYMDKIIRGSNYTYDCAFFDTNFFKRLIVPNNRNALEKNEQLSIVGDIDNFFSIYNAGTADTNLLIDYSTLSGFTTANDIDFVNTSLIGSQFNFTAKGSLIIKTSIALNPTFSAGLFLDINGTQNAIIYSTTLTVINGVLFYTLNFNHSFRAPLQTGDVIKFRLRTISVLEATLTGTSVSVNSNEVLPLPVAIGDTVKLNENLPKNILQKDFFSSIVKMFNLMIVEDKDIPNHLNITPYIDFYDIDPDNALDWTYKLDRSKPFQIIPMSEANARYYNIKFKADTDFYNDKYKKKYNSGYGDVIFDNALDFAKDNITKEVIFSSSPLVGYPEEDKIVCPIFKWDGVQPQNEEPIGSTIRIMQAKKIEGVTSWDIVQEIGGTVLATFTDYPYAGHFDDPDLPASDVNFDVTKELYYQLTDGVLTNNLFNAYWLPYMYEIIDKDSKLLTATFRLHEQDINELDFSKLIYIDGILYRLSKIMDYNASERDVCKVELLKVMQLTYTAEATVNCIADEDFDCIDTEVGDPLLAE
jgi:hypothetical protein